MTSGRPLPLLAGRILAFVGIFVLAMSLRTAVAALSPIYAHIDASLKGGAIGLGVLGMLPPLCFAVFGLSAPRLVRRFGLEPLVIGSALVMTAGHVLRSLGGSFTTLIIGSILCFAAMGIGNVVLPPLVKRYFPDRIGLMTSIYATVMGFSTFVPPLIAVPIADAVSWQLSLAMWSIVSFVAVIPWTLLVVRQRRDRKRDGATTDDEPRERRGVAVTRSRTAWAIMTVFASSAVLAYTTFAWLPAMLTDIAGSTPAAAGALLGLFGMVGVPSAFLVPVIAMRVKDPAVLVYTGVGFILIGYLGLLVMPRTATWLWVVILGVGPLLFPLALALINLRTVAQSTTVALSGFVQGAGYTLAAIAPVIVGVVHAASGNWTIPMVFLIATALPGIWAARVLTRGAIVDDELRESQTAA